MASIEQLGVAYHQQDTDVYCGAACAQMVLDSMGAGLQSQDDLYADARNHTAELASWYNPPDGLQWLMNDRRPPGFGGWFALYSLDTEDALSRKLVWTIHHYHVAPIALVFGGDHWLVVRGYEASNAPSSSADVGFSITAFEVNNPWPPVPSFYAPPTPPPPAPPPHAANDGCGTGGNRGTALEHISYSTWQSTYMTGNKYGSLWIAKNVAVCDPDPPSRGGGPGVRSPRRSGGDELLSPSRALELAIEGVQEHRLNQRKEWRHAFEGAAKARPMLVQRLDRLDTYYYIVPFGREDAVGAAVSVDARFGDYQQAIALQSAGLNIFTALDNERIREMTLGRRHELGGRLGRMLIRKEAYCLYPTLVWRPCLESLSPFHPFHMITAGDYRIYVRVDGRIFTKLHTYIPGI